VVKPCILMLRHKTGSTAIFRKSKILILAVERSRNDSVGRFLSELRFITAIGLSPGGSGYFTCIQNMKSVTTKFKSGGLHEKHVVATCNLGNHHSISF